VRRGAPWAASARGRRWRGRHDPVSGAEWPVLTRTWMAGLDPHPEADGVEELRHGRALLGEEQHAHSSSTPSPAFWSARSMLWRTSLTSWRTTVARPGTRSQRRAAAATSWPTLARSSNVVAERISSSKPSCLSPFSAWTSSSARLAEANALNVRDLDSS